MTFPTDSGCIFCKIIAGEIPCHRLFEDEAVLSFLDVGPLAVGHALVIPKGHWPLLTDATEAAAERCIAVAKKLGPIVCELTGADGWNVLQNNGKAAGQEVDHVHFHVIPRKAGDGLGYRWNAGEIDHAAAKLLAADIASKVKL